MVQEAWDALSARSRNRVAIVARECEDPKHSVSDKAFLMVGAFEAWFALYGAAVAGNMFRVVSAVLMGRADVR